MLNFECLLVTFKKYINDPFQLFLTAVSGPQGEIFLAQLQPDRVYLFVTTVCGSLFWVCLFKF